MIVKALPTGAPREWRPKSGSPASRRAGQGHLSALKLEGVLRNSPEVGPWSLKTKSRRRLSVGARAARPGRGRPPARARLAPPADIAARGQATPPLAFAAVGRPSANGVGPAGERSDPGTRGQEGEGRGLHLGFAEPRDLGFPVSEPGGDPHLPPSKSARNHEAHCAGGSAPVSPGCRERPGGRDGRWSWEPGRAGRGSGGISGEPRQAARDPRDARTARARLLSLGRRGPLPSECAPSWALSRALGLQAFGSHPGAPCPPRHPGAGPPGPHGGGPVGRTDRATRRLAGKRAAGWGPHASGRC